MKGVTIMMTFEYVIDVFKEQIEMDDELEVLQLKHGWQILMWNYCMNGYSMYNDEVIETPEELFDALMEQTEAYYTLKFNNPKTDEMSEEDSQKVKDIISNFESKRK